MFMGLLDPALCYPQYLPLNNHNSLNFWSHKLENGLFILKDLIEAILRAKIEVILKFPTQRIV